MRDEELVSIKADLGANFDDDYMEVLKEIY